MLFNSSLSDCLPPKLCMTQTRGRALRSVETSALGPGFCAKVCTPSV